MKGDAMERAGMERPAFGEALRFWWKLGWVSFGGTAAHIALMHQFLVVEKKWVSNGRFLHALSHCMILPGPEAQQLAIYLGWKLHGKKGGLVAGSLFVLPSMFVLLALSVIYAKFGKVPWIAAMFSGLKPAVIALVIVALLRIGKKALRGPLHYVVALMAFAAMLWFNVSLVMVMAAAVLIGLLLTRVKPEWLHAHASAEEEEDERGYYINKFTVNEDERLEWGLTLRIVAVCLVLWAVPFAALAIWAREFGFWRELAVFFTKMTFVTFGGAYAVLPYVAQMSVVKMHWLTRAQVMDGLALAETTPGPLIIVVAFIGFMAGYNHFGSLWLASLALVVTTFYTFLPCFLFVFAGAPLVERTQGKREVEGVLGMITAVVVGAILELTVFLGRGVLFADGRMDWVAAVWVLVALGLVWKWRMNVMALIGLSVMVGLGRWLVG